MNKSCVPLHDELMKRTETASFLSLGENLNQYEYKGTRFSVNQRVNKNHIIFYIVRIFDDWDDEKEETYNMIRDVFRGEYTVINEKLCMVPPSIYAILKEACTFQWNGIYVEGWPLEYFKRLQNLEEFRISILDVFQHKGINPKRPLTIEEHEFMVFFDPKGVCVRHSADVLSISEKDNILIETSEQFCRFVNDVKQRVRLIKEATKTIDQTVDVHDPVSTVECLHVPNDWYRNDEIAIHMDVLSKETPIQSLQVIEPFLTLYPRNVSKTVKEISKIRYRHHQMIQFLRLKRRLGSA